MYVKARREASDLEIQMADKTQQARVQNVDENYLAEIHQTMMSVAGEPALHAPLRHSDREAAPAGATTSSFTPG